MCLLLLISYLYDTRPKTLLSTEKNCLTEEGYQQKWHYVYNSGTGVPLKFCLAKKFVEQYFSGRACRLFFLHLHFAFKNTVGDNVLLFKTIELPEFVKPKRDILRICFLYSLGSQRESFIDIERIFWPFAFSLASLILAFP